MNSPIEGILAAEAAQSLTDARQSSLDKCKHNDERKAISRKAIEVSRVPAARVDVEKPPTFNPLLNIHFESQFSVLEKFKSVISEVMARNRAQRRTHMLAQHLINESTNAVKSLQEKLEEKRMLTAASLLSQTIVFGRAIPKFATPYHLDSPAAPDLNIETHRVEKPFKLYTPGLVERFQLTPFVRTDVTTYIASPIAPPDSFPVVRDEQPIRERVTPSIDIEHPAFRERTPPSIDSTSAPAPVHKVVQHPREVRYYAFDPSYSLRPQPMALPDLPNEIGRSSVSALPLPEYAKMSMTGKTKAPFAPFEFVGTTKFADSGLAQMTGPDAASLRELEPDDDIDGIDVQPKVRPVTDFLTKPVNPKNKSHVLAEAVGEGQSHWRERQKKGVSDLIDKFKALNHLMRDKSLSLPLDDLLEYMQQ
jgi:hypothetical protein